VTCRRQKVLIKYVAKINKYVNNQKVHKESNTKFSIFAFPNKIIIIIDYQAF